MTLLIALPGPRMPAATALAADIAARLPQLPALTRLLRRAQRLADAPGWRPGVLAALGGDARLAEVSVAAAALPGITPRAALCFAAPLHVVAGISRVHLPPGGRPQFAPGEEQEFCAAFNEEFGGPQICLHVVAPGGGWLLAAPFAAATADAAPEALVGEPLERRSAAGTEQRALRRFGTEVEIWLATHALNRAREARGQVPVNTLWMWGGAHAMPLSQMQSPRYIAALRAPDAWLAGLARHAGTACEDALSWSQLMQQCGAPQSQRPARSVLLVLAPGAEGTTGAYWQQLEQDWFEPALRAVQAGHMPGLRLQIGCSAWRLPHAAMLGWLRWPRRRNWWQLTGQVHP